MKLSLHVIAKNERNHIDAWFENVNGLFEEIIFCDTGSTDGTVERAKELGLNVVHFTWVDDFSAARNFALEHCTGDYVFWMDMDDLISDREAFLEWKKVMPLSEYWFANYNYAFDANRKPICTFIRERSWKRSLGLRWQYFIHEGVPPQHKNGIAQPCMASTWTINHQRTLEDLNKDKNRNLLIFEKFKDKLDTRLRYYYGKELFEAGKIKEASIELCTALKDPTLELHDRLLAMQYTVFAFQKLGEWQKSLEIARLGIELAPQRAEFWCMTGDAYVKLNQIQNAIPFYVGATSCEYKADSKLALNFVFTHKDAYTIYPSNNLARCFAQLGQFDKALDVLDKTIALFPNDESNVLKKEISTAVTKSSAHRNAKECADVVFTCLGGLYEWDSDLAKTNGFGGSEKACIEMAKALTSLGEKVKVFNVRQADKVCEDGVEYISHTKVNDYFAENKPKLHIAWRHNFKLTDAKTMVWSHDLFTPGAEHTQNYDKYLCLSEFHKSYVHGLFGIPKDKILVTRNGINSEKFTTPKEKNPLKIVYPSSADRGLDKVIRVLDYVRETHPVELHVFYGLDNMRKMGKNDQADYYQKLIDERSWVVAKGNTQHDKLLQEYDSASIWLYPTDFLETSCITAMEMISKGVYPIVRRWGALPDTLAKAEKEGMCMLVDRECSSEQDHRHYASLVVDAINNKAWDKVRVDPREYDWIEVAKEWKTWM